jgi:uncharacterized protein (TIGR00730 family)
VSEPTGPPERLPRYRSGDPEIDRRLVELLDALGAPANRDQLFEILATVARLARDGADRLDLKITNAALREMRSAFRVFAPHRGVPKVTMFGSARTLPEDPLYAQARETARRFAAEGWMVVTGAGPGIMAAGVEGAGMRNALGVNIRLPFEQAATQFLAEENLVTMKYFFTRKLMLMKESAGFVVLPGGFGTLDEAFELFTLLQTGKADPKPVVLLEVADGTYWQGWQRFLREEVAARHYISAEDLDLYRITDDPAEAVAEVCGFYRNYHSMRWVGDRLVLRLRALPGDDDLGRLNERYAAILTGGEIAPSPPLPAEVDDADHLELARLVLRFDRRHYSRLVHLIRDLNALAPAPNPNSRQ